MSIETGQVIDGKYRVVKLLGKGGMGAVYLAEHMIIGRRVAVKVLLGSVAENETAVARFEREAQAAGRIGNDHILEIFDFGSLPDGARFMVCEYLEGETLAARLTNAVRMSPASLVPLARQLLSGLGAAHRAGVVHRDLKPENVFILRQKAGWDDFIKIIDFGISKFQPLSAEGGMQVTATGIVVGTPCYLSPEQARGSREADARSDLYAVGVILYECVTGQLPFNAANVNDLLFKIVLEAPLPIREAAPDVDPAFADIINIAMARAPESRFQTAEAFIAALDRWATEHGMPMVGPAYSERRHPSGDTVPATSADVRLPSGSPRSLAPTPGTWADSKVSVSAFEPKTRRSKSLAVIGALIGVLLVGGVSFALLRGNSAGNGDGTTAHSAAPAASGLAPTVTTAAEPVLAPVDAVAPAAPPVEAIPAAPPSDVSRPFEPAPFPTVKAPAPGKRPVAAAAPKKPTAPPAAAAAAPATATGKTKRDFGY